MKIKCWVCEECNGTPCILYNQHKIIDPNICQFRQRHEANWKRAEVDFKEEIKTEITYLE